VPRKKARFLGTITLELWIRDGNANYDAKNCENANFLSQYCDANFDSFSASHFAFSNVLSISFHIFSAYFFFAFFRTYYNFLVHQTVLPDHLSLDSAPNLGPLISHWEINKFENCWYKSVMILEVLKLLFQHFLNLSSSQRDMRGPILGALSNNRWSGGKKK
jgi:hypothetical protein